MVRVKSPKKQQNIFWQIIGVLFYILTFLVLVIGIIYFIWSIVRISRQVPSITTGTAILNFLSLPVEVIGIFYTVMLFKHISTTCMNTNFSKKPSSQSINDLPSVSVLIPIYYVIPEILETTLKSIVDSNFPREKINILIGDDTDKSYPDFSQIQSIVNRYNATFIHDTTNINFKAGMLNILLKEVKTDYVVFLDYDHKIAKNFLRKSIELLTENNELAFVQAKVSFYNIRSKLQVWESVMYAQFFEIFQKSKNRRGTVIFNGSTACFRKSVIDEVGGIPTDTFTEDIDLSIQILTKGYPSKLVDEYGSFGLIPSNF
ncbi:MAG: glycosyltransferase, partial [Candidatus Heimdallarchaeaceae archaeon]